MKKRLENISLPWRIGTGMLLWLIFISLLHFWLNMDHGDRRAIRMGYMPVITNLAAPLLDHATREGEGIRFSATKFASFAEMAEALRNGQIQAAFMIAPLSIVLRQQGEDVKVVYIGNRHESTLVTRKDLSIKSLKALSGKTLAVPMRYSGHNLSILELMEKEGLSGQIEVVEMNPPDMASALAAGSLDAYYVGEPFAAQTVRSGDSEVLFYVEKVWENFICNLLVVRQSFIEEEPETVRLMVQAAARSGLWARENTEEAALIASTYWNQPADLVAYALTTPKNRIVYERFIPVEQEMRHMAELMLRFGLLKNKDISGLVEDRFAKQANLSGIKDIKSILSGKWEVENVTDSRSRSVLPQQKNVGWGSTPPIPLRSGKWEVGSGKWEMSLIPEAVLSPAVRTFPSDAVAGHAPEVLRHALLADAEPAATPPAELLPPAAAVAWRGFGLPTLFPVCAFTSRACHVPPLCIGSSPHQCLQR